MTPIADAMDNGLLPFESWEIRDLIRPRTQLLIFPLPAFRKYMFCNVCRDSGSTSHNRTPSAAALSYITRCAVMKPFVEFEHLTWLVLHQDDRRETPELRLAGYTGVPVRWGVGRGGAERMLFEKSLSLQPRFGARGHRMDLRNTNVVRHARNVKRILLRHPNTKKVAIRDRIQLPRLWAAFDKVLAETIRG
ncbi:MAG: hypothetical protein KDA84_10795 [Planctomycetaceae bacterium]|nr:hypothetical protein [Planctomycetaceae bacterium]